MQPSKTPLIIYTHQLQMSKGAFYEYVLAQTIAAMAAASYHSLDSPLFSEDADPDDPEPELDTFEINRMAHVAAEVAEQAVLARGPDGFKVPREAFEGNL
jgi:hypothetical protein